MRKWIVNLFNGKRNEILRLNKVLVEAHNERLRLEKAIGEIVEYSQLCDMRIRKKDSIITEQKNTIIEYGKQVNLLVERHKKDSLQTKNDLKNAKTRIRLLQIKQETLGGNVTLD